MFSQKFGIEYRNVNVTDRQLNFKNDLAQYYIINFAVLFFMVFSAVLFKNLTW